MQTENKEEGDSILAASKDKYASQFNITKLTEPYIDKLVDAATIFFAESDFKNNEIGCSPEKFKSLLHEYIHNPYVSAVIATDEQNDVIGFTIIYCQDDYTDYMIGDLYLFYVKQAWRGKGVSRQLIAAAVEQWKSWGCKRVYTEAASGLKNPQFLPMFKNLWGKFGFTDAGIVLKLEL